MAFVMPLEERQRRAKENRERYWSNPADRLKRINADRARRGRPVVASLAEVETRGRPA